MGFKAGGKRKKGGWQVISGRRSFREIFDDYKVVFTIFGVTIFSAALTAYLYFIGPLAISRYKAEGFSAIRAGDYIAAAISLEKADSLSNSKRIDILYPLGVAYFTEERYADAINAFDSLVLLFGGEIPYRNISAGINSETAVNDGLSAPYSVRPEFVEKPFVPVEAFMDAPALPRACYFLAEAYAYTGDADAAYDAAYYGFITTGDIDLMTLADTVIFEPPLSLTSSGVYNGGFVFRFEPVAEGVRTLYTLDENPAAQYETPGDFFIETAAEYDYAEGLEIGFGDYTIRAINVNRYGLISEETSYIFSVLDAAGNLNGNIVNGAIAVERGDEVFYFNGKGIYRESPAAGAARLTEGNNIGCLNLLGEWLYFTRNDGVYTGIYKIRVDGTGLTRISEAAAEYLQTAGNKLYYTTRDGLYSMPPDGGETALLAEGGVLCVNYYDGRLYFFIELPDGGIDDAGPVYYYDINNEELKRLIDDPVSFLQVYDDRLYYIQYADSVGAVSQTGGEAPLPGGLTIHVANLDGSPSGRVTLPPDGAGATVTGGSDSANPAAQGIPYYSSGARGNFLADSDHIYYYSVYGRSLYSIDISAAAQGLGGASRALTEIDQFDCINIAAGYIYGCRKGGDGAYDYFRLPSGQNGAHINADGGLSDIENLSARDLGGSVRRYGNKLYYVDRDANGEQYVYSIATAEDVNDPVAVALTAASPFVSPLPAAAPSQTAAQSREAVQSEAAQSQEALSPAGSPPPESSPRPVATPQDGGTTIGAGLPEDGGASETDEPGAQNSLYDIAFGGVSPVGEILLSGIPQNEQIIYIGDRFVITSDYIDARVYTYPVNGAGTAPGDNGATGPVVFGSALYNGLMESLNETSPGGGVPEGGQTGENADEAAQADDAAENQGDDDSVVAPGGETSDIEASELSMDTEETAGPDAGGESGEKSAEPAFDAVIPEVLSDNGMHMWHGLSNFRQYGDRLYFTSQAGFFSADIGFMTAAFITGEGPEIGEDFIVDGGRVFFKRGIVSGEGGLYMLDLANGVQKRIYGGIVAGFDISANIIYYTDAADGSLYMQDIDSDNPAVKILNENEMACDIVYCREGGGIVVRSPENGYGLYTVDIAKAQSRRLAGGGAGQLAYYRDFIYYEAWDMPGVFIRLDVKRAEASDESIVADSANDAGGDDGEDGQ